MRILNKYSWRCKFKMMVGDEVEVQGGDLDKVEEQDGDQADDQLEQTEDEEVEVLGGDQDEVEV